MTSAPDPYAVETTDDGAEHSREIATVGDGAPPRRDRPRSRRTTAIAVVGLILALAVWGWFATANAREGWWAMGDHIALTPDEQGWAGTGPVQLRLAESTDDVTVDDGSPPAGFRYLEIVLEVDSTETESTMSCDVQVLDADGRLFLAGREVPGLGEDYVSSLTCGTSDPAEYPVEPVQAMLVLLPEDAEPVSVRVSSTGFPPARFVELPLP